MFSFILCLMSLVFIFLVPVSVNSWIKFPHYLPKNDQEPLILGLIPEDQFIRYNSHNCSSRAIYPTLELK